MRRSLPTVAIIGRPNVGKSTFFNRIIGRRQAIVEDQPGVTRDRNFARTDWAGHGFHLVDTGGLEPESDAPLATAIRRQVLTAIEEADLLVFLVDGQTGPHPLDFRIAEILRKSARPVVLVVNKMDRLAEEIGHHDFWSLGLDEPVPVSALSGKGSGDVLDTIIARFPDGPRDEDSEEALYVAVIGKPNVGKSSFINRLLGEERLVVSEVAGTTRDSIDTVFRYHDRDLVFIDTAGLRRQAKIDPGLEFYASVRTARAVERADICLLLIDASEPLHIQDIKVAEKAWNAGCGLIIVANKWDLVEKDDRSALAYERHLRERVNWFRWVPVIFTSVLTGQRVQRTLELVLEVEQERERRIPTSEVNEVVRKLAERKSPPHFRGMPVKLMYATQVDTRPPSFVIFTNHPKGITENYSRYLQNGFRMAWGFTGAPMRLRFRGRKEEP